MIQEQNIVKPETHEEKTMYTLLVGNIFQVDIKQNIYQLQKMISSKQLRQVLKLTKSIRKYKNVLKPHHFKQLWIVFYPKDQIKFQNLKEFKPDFNESVEIPKHHLTKLKKVEEIDLYLQMLLLGYYMKHQYWQKAQSLNKKILTKIQNLNSFYANALNSIAYFYIYRVNQIMNQNNLKQLNSFFMSAYKRSILKKDELTQATLLNLILRTYIKFNQYQAAKNFIQYNQFPQNRSNNQFCKYLYYTGIIKLIYMQYQQSYMMLTQAIHKIPDGVSKGVKLKCLKAAIVAELLLGEIPSRDIFDVSLGSSLALYFELIQNVLKGNLHQFKQFISNNIQQFLNDKLYYVIIRLYHVVIKIGLRKINLSYSRISLQDISKKLSICLNDSQYVVAKAIRDGVLDAYIDNEQQILIMNSKKDIYKSQQPQNAFAKRIQYCLSLYHSGQKAITFPKKQFEEQRFSNPSDTQIDALQMFMDLQDY